MWKIKAIDLEPSNRCNAACPMCARVYGGVPNSNFTLADLDPTILKKLDPYLEDKIETISMCGNYGDPIINPRLEEMIDIFKEMRPKAPIMIHTNGGVRNDNFWKYLGSIPNLKVRFGIDGLEDTNHIYRKNVKWDRVIKNARTFIDAGGTAFWKFIIFKHNEHQIAQAQKMAEEIGFVKFEKVKTNRFVLDYTDGMFLNDGTAIEPSTIDLSGNTRTSQKYRPKAGEVNNIQCYAKEGKRIYVNALGEVFPCCNLAYLDGGTPSYDKLEWLDRNKISLYYNDPEDIFKWFAEIESRWNTPNCLKTCNRVCGKKADPHLIQDVSLI